MTLENEPGDVDVDFETLKMETLFTFKKGYKRNEIILVKFETFQLWYRIEGNRRSNATRCRAHTYYVASYSIEMYRHRCMINNDEGSRATRKTGRLQIT